MESLTAAEVPVPAQPAVTSPEEPAPTASDPEASDPLGEFSRRLEDIIGTYAAANAAVLDTQGAAEDDLEVTQTTATGNNAVAMETETVLIRQTLSRFPSQQDQLDELVQRHATLVALRRSDEQLLSLLQHKFTVLQVENQNNSAARSKLETLCRDLQGHYRALQEEALRRCRQDDQRRTEMGSHFQEKLVEIQAQIEQHSARNDKLCRENANLTDKLESLVNQCEQREESLEKINKHRDLQQKLSEARLQQANALLAEAEQKHKREKEYLLREAIDKTKKCFAMKEQELAMKKKLLVQAAEWKLQVQTLREQETVMQAQLTLYGQKFDEFQETLAKSNQIYARFKKEMDNMTEKMKKMEKETNLWKNRFENCNKALSDMMEQRTEKDKEYELFVLKIQKLEKLCRALQDERAILYEKIKEIRNTNLGLRYKVLGNLKPAENQEAGDAESSAVLTPAELQELQELQDKDPALTEDMSRLREEQAKLDELASSLFGAPSDDEEKEKKEVDVEEDAVSAALLQFKKPVSVPEPAGEVVEEVPKADVPASVENVAEVTPAGEEEAANDRTPVDDKEPQETQQPPEVHLNPPADLKPEGVEAEAVVPVEEEEVQAEETPEEAGEAPESTPPSEKCPETAAASDSSKKQTAKKKKRKNGKKVG